MLGGGFLVRECRHRPVPDLLESDLNADGHGPIPE
jgi:hypothetical protein